MHHRVGRNDPCPCGSGKKFKKCCEAAVKHKKIHAELLSETAAPPLASLFKRAHPVQHLPAPPPNTVTNPDL